MMKNLLFAAALLSLALASGCAKGGSGPCAVNCPAILVTGASNGVTNITQAGLNLPITVTAAPQNVQQTAVNWTITGTSCTGSGSSNPCGSFTSTTSLTAIYQAPSAVPTDSSISVVATSQADPNLSGSLPLNIIPDTTIVAPAVVSVGLGLTQQFTSAVTPDNAPQQFTWTCLASGVPCVNFVPGPNGVGTATYTPAVTEQCGAACVVVSTVATVDPTGCSVDPKHFPCTPGKTTVVPSRVTGTYAFQFSGFDNGGKAVSVAGTFLAAADGTVSSGIEDIRTASGALTQVLITGGAFTPSSDPANSNNAGTLTLTPSGAYPNKYQVVLDAAGDILMVESDANGSGSGNAVLSTLIKFNSDETFAFGFTGVDSSGSRVGYAGLFPFDGAGSITSGTIDVNVGGNNSNPICHPSAPCTVAGAYSYNQLSNHGTLSLTSPVAMNFDFFVAGGSTNSKTPLTLYAISTDPVSATPAVVGTMVLQDSTKTYNNGGLTGTSVSVLTGTNANVSLTLGTTDGTTDSSGNGGFSGQFDWNNDGAMVSYPDPTVTPPQAPFAYKYAAATANNGRYTIQMLGNPGATPAVPPQTFVLYASGANRGFLLDPTSTAVITGAMYAQVGPKQNLGFFPNSLLPGTYAVATSSNSVSSIPTLTMNLLLTSPGNQVFNLTGKQNPGNITLTGTYNVTGSGPGTFTLTAPATTDYIFYAVTATDFYMIVDGNKDKGVASPILFVAQ